ncbi:hypothetical protein A2415_04205 [candidate division WWE3 bacterium RIFOXYC1_FULL_39_7]|uniref:Metal-dependent hydrolase n=2 Tax=Katanobacteria TaxID=422282 RepID=A0A1F4X7J7_UNCKA|nr:MAG: hypothetical protein A2415_04205 [candidate division WWE3 bacterium RIFOXYC1_FULL_39_7]OGC77654.1 MAG: hypothetical protein A2619_05460 [candidate division WWE3 bacterium RIFOXYD1_FULL_39_9]
MTIHVALGILCAYIIKSVYPEASSAKLLFLGVLANLLPDADHILYFTWYGAKSDYTKIVRQYFRTKQIRTLVNFIKQNHKNNTGIYSHNLLTVAIVLGSFWVLGITRDSPSLSVFFMSWSIHYIYDIFEDLLFFKSLNPNWFFRFNSVRKKHEK